MANMETILPTVVVQPTQNSSENNQSDGGASDTRAKGDEAVAVAAAVATGRAAKQDEHQPVRSVSVAPQPQAEPEPQAEPQPEPHTLLQPRSILNAASDSSDSEETAATETAAPLDDNEEKEAQGKEEEEDDDDDDDEEDDVLPPVYGEKGVVYTTSELFVNDNLKRKSANAVLKKDPFAIPRATDNVTEYRPRFNPLNILVSEEKLLPHNFTFDFSEGIPGDPQHPHAKQSHTGKRHAGASDSPGTSDNGSGTDAGDVYARSKAVAPIRNPAHFGDKLSTMGLLMGSMPRQAQASPLPLINTPTVHNPFGEPLLELVATTEPPLNSSNEPPVSFQRLRPVPHPPLVPVVPGVAAPPHTPMAMETLGTTLDFDALGVDLTNISGLSKLSIAAAADPVPFQTNNYTATYDSGGSAMRMAPGQLPPQTPPATASSSSSLFADGLATYLPNYYAEKRIPPTTMGVMAASLYEVPPYHGDGQMIEDNADFRDSFEDDYAPQATRGGGASASHGSSYDYHHHHHHQQLQQQYLHEYQHQQQYQSSSPSTSPPSQSLQPIAKKSRSKNVFRPCTTPGCTKGARGKSGLCQKHGGGKRCATPDCPKGAQGSSKFCLFHGGGYRCTAPGCTTGARGTSGLCAKHGGYKRARGGSDEDGDAMDMMMGGGGMARGDGGSGGQAAKNPRLDYEGRALDA